MDIGYNIIRRERGFKPTGINGFNGYPHTDNKGQKHMEIEDQIMEIFNRLSDEKRVDFINKLTEILSEQIVSENQAE